MGMSLELCAGMQREMDEVLFILSPFGFCELEFFMVFPVLEQGCLMLDTPLKLGTEVP